MQTDYVIVKIKIKESMCRMTLNYNIMLSETRPL